MRYERAFLVFLVLKGQFTLMYDFISSEQHQRDYIIY